MERTAMSRHELERATVMGRVKNRDLKLSDAAVMLDGQLSAGKKTVAAISQAGQRRAKSWQRGSAVEPNKKIAKNYPPPDITARPPVIFAVWSTGDRRMPLPRA